MNRKGGIFSQEPMNEYISHTDPLAVKQIEKVLSVYLKEAGDRPIVIVCIGTDRSTGDSARSPRRNETLRKAADTFSCLWNACRPGSRRELK